MTDKEKLESMLPYAPDRLEDIVAQHLRLHSADFQPSRLLDFIKLLEIFLDAKINRYEFALDNSLEKASYIKSYLDGTMWKNEEAARNNIDAQINNAESIIDFWYVATDRIIEKERK